MPAFLIPILEWIAQKILTVIFNYASTQIEKHEESVAQDAADKAALDKLNAAQSTADRVSAAKDALNGL